ncbi:MAG: anti-sigma-factor antagonist [Bryobacterales bacterium]|nr:anti-sigma-factor antagonist [Bryobacterales bacterium]
MALAIEHRTQEGIEILDLRGRLTLGEEDLVLRDEIDKAISAGHTRLVLDLGKVTDIDTTGLGTLLFALAQLRNAGGGLALADLRLTHLKLLVLAKMEAVFEVFHQVQDAVNSFFPERQIRHYDVLEFVESMEPK